MNNSGYIIEEQLSQDVFLLFLQLHQLGICLEFSFYRNLFYDSFRQQTGRRCRGKLMR